MTVKARLVVPTVALCGCLALLAGCSAGAHQIIKSSEQCSSCHSDEKTTYDDASVPSSAVSSGTTVTVKTSESQVYVCQPVFTASDGSYYVPRQYSTVSVSGGEAQVTLEEGVWVLALDQGDTAKSVLVNVSASSSEQATVEL